MTKLEEAVKAVTVPDGLKFEPLTNTYGHYVVTKPGVGYVTVDFVNRGYRSGICVHGRFDSSPTNAARYRGRGWHQRLVDDAVGWLESIATKRTRSA